MAVRVEVVVAVGRLLFPTKYPTPRLPNTNNTSRIAVMPFLTPQRVAPLGVKFY